MGLKSTIKNKYDELYDNKSILRSLVVKFLFGKYKYSYLGFAWHFIPPIIYMILCYIIFTEIRSRSMENYWFFLSSGIFMFHMLTSSVAGGTNCFVGSASMIKKMYFPRELLAISQSITSMIIMTIGYVIVIVIAAITGMEINWYSLIYVPVIFALTFFFSLGCILFLSSITVYVRDIHHLLSSMGIVFFVVTPLRYAATDAVGILSTIIWYNPFTYYVEAMHSILYYHTAPELSITCMCVLFAIVLLIIGIFTFNKLKHGFVERL